MRQFFLFFVAMLLFCSDLIAQPSRKTINVVIAPSHADWTYKTGEKAELEFYVLQNNVMLTDVTLNYEYGPEKMDAVKKGTLNLKKGSAKITIPGMKNSGFQRINASVVINGKTYSDYITLGYEPEKIRPTVVYPADFEQFWEDEKAKAAKVELKPKMTLAPDLCTDKVNVYYVEYQNERPGSYMYGVLCIPKKPGKYPAKLNVPGAGIRPYGGDVMMAEKGFVTLSIGIHGIPVNLPQRVYNSLSSGALSNYMAIKLDNRDSYYYKRVYIGCVRAIDFLCSLEQVDQERIVVTGGSQGGALSIVTACLDKRIKFLVAYYPALCDITGYLHGRAGGWPHMFRDKNELNIQKKAEVVSYFDVVNFARNVKVPGFYCWGYNDPTCPPTSMYAAYNLIPGEKKLMLMLDSGHWLYPEESEAAMNWLLNKLNVK